MEYILLGLQTGFIYALLGLGIVLIYRATRVLNFAHADLATFGTFITLTLAGEFPSNTKLVLSGIAGAISSGILAFLFYFFILYEGQRRALSPLSLTIITIAIAFFIQGFEILVWGAEPKSMPALVSGRVKIFGVETTKSFLLISSVSIIIMAALYFLVMKTKFGIAMRAISQNQEAARILGIKIRWIVGITWGISALIGGIAGILIAPLYFVDQYFLFDPFLKAFIGAVIGGLDSPPGAIVGSLIVGVAESLFGGYVSIKFKTTFVFIMGLIFLAIRPEGIFGREIKERV